MTESSQKKFLRELFNLFGQVYVEWYVTFSCCSLLTLVKNISREASASANTTWAMGKTEIISSELGKEIYPYTLGVKPPEPLLEDSRLVTRHRKKIRNTILESVKNFLVSEPSPINESEYLEKLLNFEIVDKISNFQQCKYLLNMEKFICLTGHTSLLALHGDLLNKLKLQKTYANLFPIFIDAQTHTIHNTFPLPSVLIELVVEYCKFCWHTDEDEVFNRLLCLE